MNKLRKRYVLVIKKLNFFDKIIISIAIGIIVLIYPSLIISEGIINLDDNFIYIFTSFFNGIFLIYFGYNLGNGNLGERSDRFKSAADFFVNYKISNKKLDK